MDSVSRKKNLQIFTLQELKKIFFLKKKTFIYQLID